VAFFAAKNYPGKLQAFTVGFEEPTYDESKDARVVAQALGLDYNELYYSNEILKESMSEAFAKLDEPFGDSTALPILALSKYARRKVKTVLTGWGGDEVFAGYPTLKAHRFASMMETLPKFITRDILPAAAGMMPVSEKYMSLQFIASRFVRGFGLSPEYRHFAWMGCFGRDSIDRLFSNEVKSFFTGGILDPVEDAVRGMDEKDMLSRIMRLDYDFYLQGNGLFEADRMTMASSLEARVPLLNPALANYVTGLPAHIKMPGGAPKQLMRNIMKDSLPEKILSKPKKGFGPPASLWLRDVFRDDFNKLFDAGKVNAQGVFNTGEIQKLFREHIEKKADHGRNLWALMGFQMWYDKYIGGGAVE
jgi:asparagine synthase (glutamine-hydrolysing)